MLKDLTKALPAIRAEDKAKKKTGGVNDAFAKELGATLAAHEAQQKAQRTSAQNARKATAKEQAARTALSAELVSIRADVGEVTSDPVVLDAFGRGRNLGDKVTGPLLDAATDFASAFDAHEEVVKPAGVNPARIAKLDKLRAALADADTSQRGEISGRQDATTAKGSLLDKIKKMAAQGRARLVRLAKSKAPKGKSKKKKPAVGKSTSPRKKVKPRARKGGPGDGVAKT